ncbi:MAG TPA: hypothetical protein VF228_21900 [Iamia sp.]
MTSFLARIRRWRRPADAPLDPTRPHVVMRDGLPIVHEGPPGFPGPEAEDEHR